MRFGDPESVGGRRPSVMRTIHCISCNGRGHVVRLNPAWLRFMREKAGISLRAMARHLGVSPAYVCDVEHGLRAVPDAWRAEYAKAAARPPA